MRALSEADLASDYDFPKGLLDILILAVYRCCAND